MAKHNVGPKNGQWKGGKARASHGYILVKVGKDHHLAFSNGYAYEHRVVAEGMLGRRLEPGEVVHHKDGNKANNAPGNLEIMPSASHHRAEHRSPASRLRAIEEENPIVPCGCGCGESFEKFDGAGRPRRFIPSHNNQSSPTMDAILAVLADGPLSRSSIIAITGLRMQPVGVCLSKLKARGLLINPSRGVWKRTGRLLDGVEHNDFPRSER